MTSFDLQKPCNQCPFRRESAPGWLGPWEANELLRALRFLQEPLICHKTISEDDWDIVTDNHQACAGAAIFQNNSLALSRDHTTAEYQRELKQIPGQVKESVFQRDSEFLEHHLARTGKEGKPQHDN